MFDLSSFDNMINISRWILPCVTKNCALYTMAFSGNNMEKKPNVP